MLSLRKRKRNYPRLPDARSRSNARSSRNSKILEKGWPHTILNCWITSAKALDSPGFSKFQIGFLKSRLKSRPVIQVAVSCWTTVTIWPKPSAAIKRLPGCLTFSRMSTEHHWSGSVFYVRKRMKKEQTVRRLQWTPHISTLFLKRKYSCCLLWGEMCLKLHMLTPQTCPLSIFSYSDFGTFRHSAHPYWDHRASLLVFPSFTRTTYRIAIPNTHNSPTSTRITLAPPAFQNLLVVVIKKARFP